MPDERMWMLSISLEGGSVVDIAGHALADFDHVFNAFEDISVSGEKVINIEGVKGFDRAPQRTAVIKDKIVSMSVVRY